jgi:hypothetical protein
MGLILQLPPVATQGSRAKPGKSGIVTFLLPIDGKTPKAFE